MNAHQLKKKLEEELRLKEEAYNNDYDNYFVNFNKLQMPRPHLLVQINYIKEILSWLE